LRVITARPTVEEEAQAEHALYGVMNAREPTSVARWLALVEPVIRRAWAEDKLPLLVGGTGMYLSALREGLAVVPEIPAELRARLRERYPGAEDGALHAALASRDPLMAAQLKPGDTQRLLRALEVVEATGQSLAEWQAQTTTPPFPEVGFLSYYIDMPREESYRRIDQRFALMMQQGALEEVRALMEKQLHPDTPILRAHGVPELAAYLRGEMTLEEAIAKAQQHTRNYAKRQMTWIRNQLPDAMAVRTDAPLKL
jgi:tRNA dimethylallyltransferase